jgi:hypothetical protein
MQILPLARYVRLLSSSVSLSFIVCRADAGGLCGSSGADIISPKVFITSFCKSQFLHKSVNLSFIITYIKSKLTDLCGNKLLQNYSVNTLCGIGHAHVRAREKYRGV